MRLMESICPLFEMFSTSVRTGAENSLSSQVLKDGLSSLNVPYSYGFAIILLTVLVKAATFPLTKRQVGFAILF